MPVSRTSTARNTAEVARFVDNINFSQTAFGTLIADSTRVVICSLTPYRFL